MKKSASKMWLGILTMAVFAMAVIGCDNLPDNEVYQEQPGNTHTHEWGEWHETTAHTCTTDGVEQRICSLDPSHIQTRVVPKAHTWGEWAAAVAPTCTETGIGVRVCIVCDETDPNTVIPAQHTWGEWSVATPPTCTNTGIGIRVCIVCNETDPNKAIPALGHDWGDWMDIAATITEDGEHKRTCSNDHSHDEIYTIYATGTPGLEYEFYEWPFYGYSVSKGTIEEGEVYIPAYWRENAEAEYIPVKLMGNGGAFSGTEITSVYIGTNVEYISEYAFSYCVNLINVLIPDSVKGINGFAFMDCENLKSITIPDSVTSIGAEVFASCTSLTSVTIPDSVTSIEYLTFASCTSLTSVTIGNSVTSIGSGAFAWCTSLTSITIPNSITSIEDGAFQLCTSLTSVTIGNSVTSIEDLAFYGCTSLTSVIIPNSVTCIRYRAFEDCDLTSVTFEGFINSNNFYEYDGSGLYAPSTFPGDLREKFYETDPIKGTPGTYTRSFNSWTWILQES
jgi:hypothetical protein